MKQLLLESAQLGNKVAALLDTETCVHGVTLPPVRSELRIVCRISREGGGSLKPESGDLKVSVGWGRVGKYQEIMPGQGKFRERKYTEEERSSINEGSLRLGLDPEDTFARFGENTYDIFLNDVAYWKNVPNGVWNYVIGGYQVLKKWLSYREHDIIHRSINADEAREFTNIGRRIAAILLLEAALNENYKKVKSNTYVWKQ